MDEPTTKKRKPSYQILLSVSVYEADRERLNELVEREGTSRSAVIREAIKQYHDRVVGSDAGG